MKVGKRINESAMIQYEGKKRRSRIESRKDVIRAACCLGTEMQNIKEKTQRSKSNSAAGHDHDTSISYCIT